MTLRHIDELTYAYKTYGVRIVWHRTDPDDHHWVALAWKLGDNPPYKVCAYGNEMDAAQREVEEYLDGLKGSAPQSIEVFGIDNFK